MTPVPASGLLVGAANDPLELEAEATSERIVEILRRHRSQPITTTARQPVPLSALRRHGGGAPAVEVGAAGGRLSDATSTAIDRLRGRGRPLSDPVRAQMEGAFGVDFSSTRVHTGSAAADLNRQVGAQAFTVGQDIVLGQGSADAVNEADQRVLAHELAHVVQNRTGVSRLRRPCGDEHEPIRRLVGFEVELSVPTLKAGATTPLAAATDDGPAPDPQVGTFFAGGVGYNVKMGKLPWAHGADIDLKADHNSTSRAGAALFEAIGAASPQATAGAAYVKLSNLEYATPALDELADGSDTTFKALATAIDAHASKIFEADPQSAMTVMPNAPNYLVGVPRAHINAWMGPIPDKEKIKEAARELLANVRWHMYIQATVGILPTGLETMYASQAAELPAGEAGDMDAAMKDAANTVVAMSTTYDQQPFFDTYNESRGNDLTVGDQKALKGIVTMAVSYAIGNAVSQTAVIGGTSKNSIQMLNKLTHMGLVTDALGTKLLSMKGKQADKDVLALIKAVANWIHTAPQTTTDYWGAAPYNAPVVRERIYGKGVTPVQATCKLLRDFFTGTATAGEVGPGTPLTKNDDAPAAAGTAGGQKGIPLETRWNHTMPTESGQLWPAFQDTLNQVRLANLAHLKPETKAEILTRVQK